MPGLLDENYGVADAQRERRTKKIILITLAVLMVSTAGYFFFRTWSEERTVKEFFAKLDRKEFQQAYAMWGCTPETPCKSYDPKRFNDDWGPETPYSQGSAASVANIDVCGDGVVFAVTYPKAEPVSLWVERSTKVISFAPWPRCPGRHWEFKKFFSNLFSKS